jgi:hypothetical protein
VKLYFFGNARHTGVDAGAGHYLHEPDARGRARWSADDRDYGGGMPWTLAELGNLAGDPALGDPRRPGYWPNEAQPEGVARLHHRAGWTAIAFWDRTGDARYASSATLIVEGEHGTAAMLALFAERFPAVWARITARYQPVAHAGNVEPQPRLRVQDVRLRFAEATEPPPPAAVHVDDALEEPTDEATAVLRRRVG